MAHQPLTAGPLRRLLAGLPDDMPVILANSPEGNGFSPLATADSALYLAGSPYSGEWYPDAAYRAANPDEQPDEAPDGTVAAVFLWPSA